MKRDAVCFFLIIFLSQVVFLNCNEAIASELSTPDSIELEVFNENQEKEVKFTVKNISGGSLELLGVESSCACTDTRMEGESIIKPGDERQIFAKVNFGYLPGNYKTKIEIQWRAENSKHIQENVVELRGRIESPVILAARIIDLGVIDQRSGKVTGSIVGLRGNSPLPWDEIVARSSSEALTIFVEEINKERYRIHASITPNNLSIGQNRFLAKLTFRSKGIELPGNIEIPVLARVTGPISAQPTSLYFGRISEAGMSKTVTVRSEKVDLGSCKIFIDDERIGLTKLLVSANELKITAVVQLHALDKSKPLTSFIRIEGDSGPLLNVPVIGFFDVAKTQSPKS